MPKKGVVLLCMLFIYVVSQIPKYFMSKTLNFHIPYSGKFSLVLIFTVAEKDTAAAAKAAVGRPKAAVGRQRAAHRLRLAAAARPRPPICLKIDSLAYNGLIRLLSRTHAQAVSLSVSLCTYLPAHAHCSV